MIDLQHYYIICKIMKKMRDFKKSRVCNAMTFLAALPAGIGKCVVFERVRFCFLGLKNVRIVIHLLLLTKTYFYCYFTFVIIKGAYHQNSMIHNGIHSYIYNFLLSKIITTKLTSSSSQKHSTTLQFSAVNCCLLVAR
jgi:hypothetical protein